MSALSDNIVQFKLPKKPRIKEKEPLPDQRKVAVLPIRALTDKRITDGMFRTLALVCSYANRAGITWVSQARLSKDAGVTRQAISKQLVKLRALGYIETVSKAFKGVKPDTVRIIFDPTVDTETAIAVTSSIEDTRPPEMIKEQEQQIDNTINYEGLRRIQDMIKGALKPMNQPPKEYNMPTKGDTVTVAKMKAELAAHKAKKTRTHATLEVAPKAPPTAEIIGSHTQPYTQPNEVAHNTKRTLTDSLIDNCLKEVNEGYLTVLSNSLTDNELRATLLKLQERCQAEGVPMPRHENLVEALLVLHADSL